MGGLPTHTPPSSLGKLGAWQLQEAAAAARARLVSAAALCPELAGSDAAGSLGWLAGVEETAVPTKGAPSAQTFLARQPPLSLQPGRGGNLEPKPLALGCGKGWLPGCSMLGPSKPEGRREHPTLLGHGSQGNWTEKA